MTQDKADIREWLTVLFKYKRSITTIFAVIVITIIVGTFMWPRTYQATSNIMVQFDREYIDRPSEQQGQQGAKSSTMLTLSPTEIINSEISILTSQELIEKVVTTMGINNLYPKLQQHGFFLKSWLENVGLTVKMTPFQKAVLKFTKDLNVEVVKSSNVIEVSFPNEDPEIAARAVNLLDDLYKERHLHVYRGPQSSFLEKQLDVYAQKLKESENELEAFKQEHSVFSLAEQRSLLLTQRMGIDTELKSVVRECDELEKKLASLKSQMKGISEDKSQYTVTERDRIIVDAEAQLLTLKLKEQNLLEKYKEDHPLVVDVRNEISMVTNYIAQQEGDITVKVSKGNSVYQAAEQEAVMVEANLTAQIAKEKILSLQLQKDDMELHSLELQEKKLNDLSREVDISTNNYKTYVDKLEESRISENMYRQIMSNVSVIQAASVPAKPKWPKKILNFLIAIILGAASSIGYAFFAEYVSQGFSSPESAENRLNLPILAAISYKKPTA